MIANKEDYLGREIEVRAFWVSNNHGSQIFDDDGRCPREGIWLRGASGIEDDRRAAKFVSRSLRQEHYPEVVLRGSLRKEPRCTKNGVPACFEYFFGDAQIVAAKPGHPFHEL